MRRSQSLKFALRRVWPLAGFGVGAPAHGPVSFSAKDLDLHGCARDEAARLLDKWLNYHFLRGAKTGRVICGYGRGVLLASVATILTDHLLVEAFTPELAAYVVAFAEGGPHAA